MKKITIDEYCKKPKGSFRKFVEDQESNGIIQDVSFRIAKDLFARALIQNVDIPIVIEVARRYLDKYKITDKD